MKDIKLIILIATAVASMSTTQHSHSGPSSALASANSQGDKITIERAQRGIVAELVDQDDYYFHNDGSKVKLYRKKDIYLVKKRPNSSFASATETMQRFKGQFGNRVNAVTKHQFGSATVVRIDNRPVTKKQSKKAFDIKPEMLASLDSSTSELSPVFTTGNGQDDLLLLPKVTLELNSELIEEEALAKLKTKYGLSLVRKLALSANVYSLAFSNSNIDSRRQFSLVRKLMRESFVAWAEPQFYFKPIKNQFTPNDALFGDQWNLTNKGFRGSRCDTDCDADNAWDIGNANGTGAVVGSGMVIAIIDDGVQLNHPDLVVDSANDRDFVDDVSSNTCVNGDELDDGTPGPDNNASPRATANCFLPGQGEALEEDNHGTAVAGIAAATGNNSIGIAGVAYGATILPIRAISDFDEVPLAADNESFCNIIAEAMEYAAQHADVINSSWSLPISCMALDNALVRVTSGAVTLGLGSKRNGTGGVGPGSPVIFASGNDASGWVKVTVPVTAGEHAYEWRLLRSPFPDSFETGDDDTAWLDDIVWPDGTTEGFESGLSQFTTDWTLNSCDAACTLNFGSEPVWGIETQSEFTRTGSQSAFVGASGSDCGNSYLHTLKDGPAGAISFWVWVSTDTQSGSDKFEFLVDGKEVLSYGDIPSFGFVDNNVAYPASLSATNAGVIAVGASKSGDLSGNSSVSSALEERASYSQFGTELDLVAPSSDQHLGITTTDRTGADGYSSNAYTDSFGGTSAAAPVVSGVAAAMLAVNGALSASQVKTLLRSSADEIGPIAYVAGRNDQHGYGRVNMFNALNLAAGNSVSQPAASCSAQSFDYSRTRDLLLPRYQPQSTEFCPAKGPLPEDDDFFCVPVKTANGDVAVFCL